MASRLIEGKGADPKRITVISNWADTSAIVPSDKNNAFAVAHGLVDRFVVLHAGNIGMSQNLDVVIDAAERLRGRPEILMLFIGDGNRRPALEAMVAARGLANVRFLPFQPRDQLRWTYASSDLCLVSLKPGLAGYIVPSKLYPILAAGRPYVAAVERLERGRGAHRPPRVRRRGDARRRRLRWRRRFWRSPPMPARRARHGRQRAGGIGAVCARSTSRGACPDHSRSGGAQALSAVAATGLYNRPA